jgi:hypothetical protein
MGILKAIGHAGITQGDQVESRTFLRVANVRTPCYSV